jgi:hypothetical protein
MGVGRSPVREAGPEPLVGQHFAPLDVESYA